MNWNDHSDLKGQHAFLGPSKYHWLRYSDDKLIATYKNFLAKEEGTWLHDYAAKSIEKRIKLADTRNALNLYVNDAIRYGLKPEQGLYYSKHAFGTADAISFKDNVLRIFDYKSGSVKASFEQLDIYAALYCLEYGVDPLTIKIVQRIYQYSDFVEVIPDCRYIRAVMDNIEAKSKLLSDLDNEPHF